MALLMVVELGMPSDTKDLCFASVLTRVESVKTVFGDISYHNGLEWNIRLHAGGASMLPVG